MVHRFMVHGIRCTANGIWSKVYGSRIQNHKPQTLNHIPQALNHNPLTLNQDKMGDFQKLKVWQEAKQLSVDVYKAVESNEN